MNPGRGLRTRSAAAGARPAAVSLALAGSIAAAADVDVRSGGDPRAVIHRLASGMNALDIETALSCLVAADAPEARTLRAEIPRDIRQIARARARERETLDARAREIRERIASAPEQDRPSFEAWRANVESGLASVDRRVRIRIEPGPVVAIGEGRVEVRAHVDGRAVIGPDAEDDIVFSVVLEPVGWRIEGSRYADPMRNAAREIWEGVSRGMRMALLEGRDALLRETLAGPGRSPASSRDAQEFERLLAALRSAPRDPRPDVRTRFTGFDRARVRIAIPEGGGSVRTWELDLRIVGMEGGYGARIAEIRQDSGA
ncbi:MAG: hypothetical protein JXP34_12640 [Planctomycetes bacterium]|nr:hypothetical protein [Planctomycetota bacterium]